MALLNYSTSVPVERTVAKIMQSLVKAGARGIHHTYTDGVLTSLTFTVDAPFGSQAYTLPVNVAHVQAVLWRQKVQPRFRTTEHAARVAWRIVETWVAAQLALIETEMVGLDQVMLPYAHTDDAGTTLYQRFVEQRSAAALLPSGAS